MAAENADVEESDTVAVWGCGPVGQFAIRSAWLLGADRVKQRMRLEDDRPRSGRQSGVAEKWGTLSVPGVSVGRVDNLPFGSAMNEALTIESGQTHVRRYLAPLLEVVGAGDVDPAFVVTHRASLEDAPELYRKFNDEEDDCIEVVVTPRRR